MKKRKIRNDDDDDDDDEGRRDDDDDAYHPRRAFGSRAMTVDGRDSFAVKMDEEHFSRIRDDGFHGGDAADILKRCRTSENEPYDEEEVKEMLEDLYERGVTVNAPFCCARGAVELKRWARLESWARWRRSDARERRAAFLEYESTSDALHAYDGGGGGTFFGFGECEVGVYVSVANGDVAEWHRDVCDNATIQLAGSKKWQVEECVVTEEGEEEEEEEEEEEGKSPSGTPFVGELAGMSRNAALEDERTCGVDHFAQPRALPRRRATDFGGTKDPRKASSADERGRKGRRMRSVVRESVVDAGETICVPRGRFHRVTPVGERVSVSADLRMTTIERGEWRAEAAYLREFMLAGLSGEERARVKELDERFPASAFPQILATPIRWIPFEEAFSNGLVLGARLEYIVGAVKNASGTWDTLKTYAAMPKEFTGEEESVLRREGGVDGRAYFNPVCTCDVANSTEHPDYDVLNIKATSALTNKDLMNEFNIYIRKGSVREDERASLESPIAFFRSDVAAVRRSPSGSERDPSSDAFAALKEVLVDANILVDDVTKSNAVFLFWKSLASRRCDVPRGDFGYSSDVGDARARSMRHTLCRDRDE